MENAGAKVVKKAAILAEGDAADREDILLEKLPLFRKLSDGEYNAIDYLFFISKSPWVYGPAAVYPGAFPIQIFCSVDICIEEPAADETRQR